MLAALTPTADTSIGVIDLAQAGEILDGLRDLTTKLANAED